LNENSHDQIDDHALRITAFRLALVWNRFQCYRPSRNTQRTARITQHYRKGRWESGFEDPLPRSSSTHIERCCDWMLRTSGATEEQAIRSVAEARSPQRLEHARNADRLYQLVEHAQETVEKH